MSAQNSNLSLSGYTYDLVSALTQDALNANLQQLLVTVGSRTGPISVYYQYADDSLSVPPQPHIMTQDQVDAMTGGNDPFSIANGTTSTNGSPEDIAIGNAMWNDNFAYAFQVTLGCPSGMKPVSRNSGAPDMPNVIDLSFASDSTHSSIDADQTVQYQMYFASFKLLNFTYGKGTNWTISIIEQPNDNPWIFQWDVDLNLDQKTNTPYNQLPPDVQKNLQRVNNLNTSSMFSLQQLLIDLNTPELSSSPSPSILGIPADSSLYGALNGFVSCYWQILESNGGVVFTSSVSPVDTSDYPESSVIPTSLNFVVSPYSADISKTGLYTLSYLVMSNNRSMPATITPFGSGSNGWNWVDDEKIQGIMAVRRALFLSYLNDVLSQSLASICMVPYVAYIKDSFMNWRFESSLTPTSPAPKYTIQNSNPVLTFSFSASDKTDMLIHTSSSIDIEVTSNVTLQGNNIICSTLLTVYTNMTSGLTQTRGYNIAQRNDITFTMTAVSTASSTAGMLDVEVTSSTVTDLTQDSDKNKPYYDGDLNPSLWAEIISLGDIDEWTSGLDDMSNSMQDLMNGYETQIKDVFNNCLGWVFPGAETYFFANPKFSNNNDLTVEVSYQAPS